MSGSRDVSGEKGNKKVIKILIACHKPSELPKNNLFLPIRVGAAKADDDFGLQRDDGGDNISDKNSSYCELTAIYWAWKNLDADYYGLFHYRRFYSFSKEKYPVSDDGHMMIRARILSNNVFNKYGLLDEKKMRQIIESNDVVVHESRPVKNLPTPMGIAGKTVSQHYAYHDGTIIRNSDISLMMDVIKSSYPSIYPYINEYMNGKSFLGYNMFIMKKKYFMNMCEFEFNVLKRIEDKLASNINERSVNANRIYGYLAEILTSAYIYYLRCTVPGIRVEELQMIYALKTEPVLEIEPVSNNAIPVVLDLTVHVVPELEFYLDVILRKFIDSCKKSKYDLLIAHDNVISKDIQKYYTAMSNNNVNIRFLDYSNALDELREVFGVNNIGIKLVLPWVLKEYSKAIVLNWNTLVECDIDELYRMVPSDKYVVAARNAVTTGRLMEVNDKTVIPRYYSIRRIMHIDVDKYFDSSVMVLNMELIRRDYSLKDILSKHSDLHLEFNDTDILNDLYKNKVKIVGQKWNYQFMNDDSVNYICTFFTPLDIYNEWKSSESGFAIGKFLYQTIAWPHDNEFAVRFYKKMSESDLWPLYIARMKTSGRKLQTRFRDKVAPVGSKRRKIIKSVLPAGSRRRTILSNFAKAITKKSDS